MEWYNILYLAPSFNIQVWFRCHSVTSVRCHLFNSMDLQTFRKKSNEKLRGMIVKWRRHVTLSSLSFSVWNNEAPLNSWKCVPFFFNWPCWRIFIVISSDSFWTDRNTKPSSHHHHHFPRLKNASTISQKRMSFFNWGMSS